MNVSNERFNFDAPINGYNNSLDLQKMIWSVAKANGRNLQVYSWSLGGEANGYDEMPSTDAYCDAGTIHPYHWYGDQTKGYAGSKASVSLLQARRSQQNSDGSWSHFKSPGFIEAIRKQMISPGKPVIATEVGWATGNTPVDPGVSTSARLRYVPRVFLETFNAGIIRTFYYNIYENMGRGYELTTGNASSELNDAGRALKNLVALTADPGAAFAVGSLNYSLRTASGMSTQDDIEASTTEIHPTLLSKRNGTFQLLLWVDSNSHDGPVNDENVTVTLNGLTASAITTYRPVQGAGAVQTFVNTGSFTVPVPDHPLINITPGGVISTGGPAGLYPLLERERDVRAQRHDGRGRLRGRWQVCLPYESHGLSGVQKRHLHRSYYGRCEELLRQAQQHDAHRQRHRFGGSLLQYA